MRESSAAQASSSSSRVPSQAGPLPQGTLSWRSPSAARSSAPACASAALGSLPGRTQRVVSGPIQDNLEGHWNAC